MIKYDFYRVKAIDEVDPGNKFDEILNEMIITKPYSITWDDVVGYENVKKVLQEHIALSLKFSQLFLGKNKSRGILSMVYGKHHPN
mgnify:FL=1